MNLIELNPNTMDPQDKIGRDLAKDMEGFFREMFKDDPEKLEAKMKIIKKTKMYSFFKGYSVSKYEHAPISGPNQGIPREYTYKNKVERSDRTAKIINFIFYPLALKSLVANNKITPEEYENLNAMITSPDEGNITVAGYIIDNYRKRKTKINTKNQ